MPRYHFHIVDGRELSDPKGTELANDAAAEAHALELASFFSRLEEQTGERYEQVKVVSDSGDELFRLNVPNAPTDESARARLFSDPKLKCATGNFGAHARQPADE